MNPLAFLALILTCLSPACAQAPAGDAATLFARGVQLARQGQHAEAAAIFQRVLRADPDHRDARYNLALALFNTGRHAEALQQFDRVLAREPEALDARRGRGLALLALKRYPEAAASLRAVVERLPRDGAAQGGLGRAYLGAGNPRKALEHLRLAVELRPTDAGLLQDLGTAEAALGNHAAAGYAFSRALALRPDSVPAVLGLARARLATGEDILAAGVLQPFAERPAPDPEVLRTLALAYERLGLVEERLRVQGQLADLLPSREAAPLRLSLGREYAQRLRWEAALHQFSAAAAGDPSSAEAFVGMAQSYRALGRTAEEAAGWRAAGALMPQDPEVWLNLAAALGVQQRDEEVLEALNRALRVSPNHRGALEMAAETARGMGRLEEATAYLRRLLALNPQDAAMRFRLVDALVDRGRLWQALQEAGEALDTPDAPAEHLVRVAHLAEQAGHVDYAAALWRRVMDRGGRHRVPAGLEVGRLLLTHGRAPEAVEVYQALVAERVAGPEVTLGLAGAYQAVGRDREAVGVLEPLVRARPELTAARVALAESLAWVGRHADALGEMQRVLQAGPLDERACRALVLAHERGGDLAAAVETLEGFLPVGGPLEVVVELLERLYRHAGGAQEAARRLLEQYRLGARHPAVGLAAARLLAETGRMDDAERLLEGMAQVPAQQEAALRELAMLHLQGDTPERALRPLRRLMEAHPPAAGVIALLAELEPRPDLAAGVTESLRDLVASAAGGPAFWAAAVDVAHVLGRSAVEEARLQALAAERSEDPGLSTGLAVLALHQGNPALAEQRLTALPPALQVDAALLRTLLQAQVTLGKRDAALATVARMLTLGQARTQDHVVAAQLLRDLGDSEEALWHLVCALQDTPDHPAALEAMRALITSAALPPGTVLEGLQQIHAVRPKAAALPALGRLLAEQPGAQAAAERWLYHLRALETR